MQFNENPVSLQCVFHSIRFKVNKGWSTAVLLFLCPYFNKELCLNARYNLKAKPKFVKAFFQRPAQNDT
ncbi:hypothetical protein FNJ61_03085 [Bacteroides pyogenes]|nr:hypothetical protein FNJ61_03085 [Bacteroides pyogenes]